VAKVRERTIPTEWPPFVSEVSARSRVVIAADPYGRNLDFLGRSRYFFCQVATQLYLRGCVDPVPDPYFSENEVVGNESGPLDL
jgi:hypothetical protein